MHESVEVAFNIKIYVHCMWFLNVLRTSP